MSTKLFLVSTLPGKDDCMKSKKTDEHEPDTPQVKEPELSRTIKIAPDVWEALQKDATRCRRSANKHLEAILAQYLGVDDVNLNDARIEDARRVVSGEMSLRKTA